MKTPFIMLLCMGLMMTSCVSKKQMQALKAEQKTQIDALNAEIGKCGTSLNQQLAKVAACEQEREKLRAELKASLERGDDLKAQVADLKSVRDKQMTQAGAMTAMSQKANENMRESLQQLAKKEEYIYLIQAARTKADSINLALQYNLTKVLSDGVADKDVEVKVDKTVVFVNL